MSDLVTRRSFVTRSAALGAGLAMAGPMSALAARTSQAGGRPTTTGYGPLQPTPEEDSGVALLALPAGFRYRVVNRSGDPMRDALPTPGVFDGMAAFGGPNGDTVLIRNHENRSFAGEIGVPVPAALRYDPDPAAGGGNTKLVVGPDRRLREVFGVLGGTHTNCAGGRTPWGTWITCEEIFADGAGGVPHGYVFEVRAGTAGPVAAVPVKAAGRFSHEAVAWLRGVLYLTEDRPDAAFYRFLPARRPHKAGDLAAAGGKLQALYVPGRPRLDMNTLNPGDRLDVAWTTINDPDPAEDTVRAQARFQGAAIFTRTEGAWPGGGRVFFDCTTGGDAGLGQLWEYRPRRAAAGLRVDEPRRPREPRQPHDRPAHGTRVRDGGRGRRAVRARHHPPRRDLRRPVHPGQRLGAVRRLLQPRRADVLRQPAGLAPGAGRDAHGPARRPAGADVRDLGAVRGGALKRRRPRHVAGPSVLLASGGRTAPVASACA
jgi:secreted PhoX family phosphatase